MARATFLFREAGISLRRNFLVVAGAILAVFISLSLAFGAMLVNELVKVNTLLWQDGDHVLVFLKDARDGITQGAQLDLQAEIESWEEVGSTHFFDKNAAYGEFKEIFQDIPALLEEVDPSLLPASIRIRLTNIEDYQAVQFRLVGKAPVKRVVSLGERIEQLSSLNRVLNGLGVGLAVVLGGSAIILIANTIRMAIYARREEVGIMKLVGAGNWFVRIPFLLEGLFEGVVGAGLAVGAVGFAANRLEGVDSALEIVRLSLPTEFFVERGVLFILFGAAAGVLGSLLGLRRFLKV